MRRIFTLSALLIFFAVGCKEEHPEVNYDNLVLKLTSEAVMEFSEEGGEGVITYVFENADETRFSPVEPIPTAECDAGWITDLSVDSSVQEITFTVLPQEVAEVRHTVIFVEFGEHSFTVTVSQGEETPEFDVEFTAEVLNGTYYGKMGTPGYNYMVILSDRNAPTAMNQYFGSTQYRLDIYSEEGRGLAVNACEVPNGTYRYDEENEGAAGTLSPSTSYYIEVTEEGNQYVHYFVDGKVEVSDEGVEAQLLLDNGEWHHVVFVGENITGGYDTPAAERPFTRLYEDFEFDYTKGYLHAYYRGDYYGLGCDVWFVDMCQTVLPMQGTYFMLTLLVDKANGGYKEDAFLGEYRVAQSGATGADLYNTFVAGDLRDGFEVIYSWCLTCEYSQILNTWGGPIVDGTIKIEKDGALYVVSYDCKDDGGNKISGTFRCGFDGYLNQNPDDPTAEIAPASL